MSFTDFMAKFNGVFVDFDGVYGAQCMDLMHQYIQDVLGLSDGRILAAPGAKDVFLNFENLTGHEYFDIIVNTPAGVPQEGDIVLYGAGVGPFGHVCIFISGDANKFVSFDENWPTGSPCHVQNHTYGYCLGWLHPKQIQPDCQSELDQMRKDRDRNWNYFITLCDIMKSEHTINVATAELNKLIQVEDINIKLVTENENLQKSIKDMDATLSDLSFKHTELISDHEVLQEKYNDAQAELTDSKKKIEGLGADLSTATIKLEQLKKDMEQPIHGLALMWKGFRQIFGY